MKQKNNFKTLNKMENQFSEKQISGHSTTSFVLGFITAVMALLTFPDNAPLTIFAVVVGLPTAIVGIVQGCKGLDIDGSTRAITGIIMNIFFLSPLVIMPIENYLLHNKVFGVAIFLWIIVAIIITIVTISDTRKRSKFKSKGIPASIHSTASLVLGLCGIVACLIPLIGFPVTIVGLVQGCKGFPKYYSGRATAGKILNIVFLGASVLSLIIGIIYSVDPRAFR